MEDLLTGTEGNYFETSFPTMSEKIQNITQVDEANGNFDRSWREEKWGRALADSGLRERGSGVDQPRKWSP